MSKQLSTEELEVRDLITGAGPRAVVPVEDVAEIKQAAREEWRAMVAREGRRRRGLRLRGGLALAASVLLALAIGWWWIGRAAPVAAPVVATVELLAGTVRADEALELTLGGTLVAGTAVETAGWVDDSPAAAALRLAGGQSLRLAADTRVRLLSGRRFELERGTLYVDSDPAAGAGGVEVLTALGTVRDIGTQFEVRLSEGDAALRLRVREGECELEAAGDSFRAARGDQLNLLDDGSLSRAEIESYGPEWEWVMATAPSIEIDGKPVDWVLSRVARETGREVRYADPALAEAAAAAIIDGTAEGLTPEETLEVVMQLTQRAFHYQLENGTILVTPAS